LGRGFAEYRYFLSDYGNELVVFGCNVVATFFAEGIRACTALRACTTV
jgi:hypothetical protein